MWKDIIGYEGLYKINEFGDIYSIRLNRLLSPYISNKGYKLIDLAKDGTRTKYSIHKLVAIHFVPNPFNLPIVLHLDNNKLNTYYTNLKWGTYSENNIQAVADNLMKVPIPDNRKYYEIYNENNSIIYYGISSVAENIGYDNESTIRTWISRGTKIPCGQFEGYKIRKKDIIRPIRFNNFR